MSKSVAREKQRRRQVTNNRGQATVVYRAGWSTQWLCVDILSFCWSACHDKVRILTDRNYLNSACYYIVPPAIYDTTNHCKCQQKYGVIEWVRKRRWVVDKSTQTVRSVVRLRKIKCTLPNKCRHSAIMRTMWTWLLIHSSRRRDEEVDQGGLEESVDLEGNFY